MQADQVLGHTFPFLLQECEKYLGQYDIALQFSLDGKLVDDPSLDDAFSIAYGQRACSITGSNQRSLLFGLYRMLEEFGFDFLAPGPANEICPFLDANVLDNTVINIQEVAQNRYRGVVMEGANSIEHLMDMIDYLPKLCYNTYFIQFFSPFYFFKNWYQHVHNPLFKKEPITQEMAMCYRQVCITELKKRGLLIHDVGHGWIGKALGIDANGWDLLTGEQLSMYEEQAKDSLAMLNAKRTFFMQIPANTHLCYSKPEVRQKLAQAVLDYATQHPDIDFIHFWLADEYNNVCECDDCRHKILSDWYVDILNLIDCKLTEAGLDTRIVFLLYNDLLWAPKESHLNNPKRFVMMFAPISRSFDVPLQEGTATAPRPYAYNQNEPVVQTEENLAFLRQWQEFANVDCFDFDYHLGRAHYGDWTYHKISEVLAQDIKHLHTFKLQGMLMCQENRAFFPTGLPNYLAGKLLWNPNQDFETISRQYYQKWFEKPVVAMEFFRQMSDYVSPDFFNNKYVCPNAEMGKRFDTAIQICRSFENSAQGDKRLSDIVRYSNLFASAMKSVALAQDDTNEKFQELILFIRSYELANPNSLDCFRVLDLLMRFFGVEVDG